MNCACSVKIRSYTNDRLRRARRLYAHLIFEACVGDRRMTAICAQRAKDRNLYGRTTTITGIYWSLCTYMSKLDQKTNPRSFGYGRIWHEWMNRFNMWPKTQREIAFMARSETRNLTV